MKKTVVISEETMIKNYSRIFFILVIVVSLFLSECTAVEKRADVLLRQFPGFHIMTIKDIDSITSSFFLKEFPKGEPGIIDGDFNGDGIVDYAALIKENDSKSAKLVIYLCADDARCDVSYQLDVSNYSDLVYLSAVKQGTSVSQTRAFETTGAWVSLILKHTGIRLTYFGKAEIVLYWDDKAHKFNAIQTSD